MSENNINNEFDLMMRAVLDEAREEVPAHVWEGISSGLDKASRRKTVVLWWRRAAVSVAAAAAVIAGVFLTFDSGDEFVPRAAEEMIAVVENDISGNEAVALLEAETVAEIHVPEAEEQEAMIPGSAAEAIEAAEVPAEVETEEAETAEAEETAESPVKEDKKLSKTEQTEYFPEDWGEEKTSKKRNISFVVSGLAGTNNSLSQNKISPMKAPTATPAPKKTGIEQKSVKSSYGIPLSFGAGVKIDLGGRWAIGTGLNYTFLSRQFYGTYTKVTPEGIIEDPISSDINNCQHYIGIPVNVFYDVISNDKISFYAYAGGTVEKCVTDSYRLLETSIVHKEKVAGVQLSANAGIGVEFMLGKHLGLYLDPSVRYYFDNKQPKSIRTAQPLMLGFELGLRARL